MNMKNEMKSSKLLWILAAIYILVLFWIILFKGQMSLEHLPHIRNINLIPFGEMLILNGAPDFGEVFDNMLIFVPLGLYLAMLNFGRSHWVQILTAAGVSLVLETLQYVLAVGASDITDLLANTLGGAVGVGIYALCARIFKGRADKILLIFASIATVIFIVLFAFIIIANRAYI